MRHFKLRNTQQFDGGFTDLFVLGTDTVPTNTNGVWSRTSDFTASATTQALTLLALNPGDVVLSDAIILVKNKITGTNITAATLSLGLTGTLTSIISNSDVFTNIATGGGVFSSPGGSGDNYQTTPIQSAKNLVANLILTGGNASAITAGEIWIYVKIGRVQDLLTNRVE